MNENKKSTFGVFCLRKIFIGLALCMSSFVCSVSVAVSSNHCGEIFAGTSSKNVKAPAPLLSTESFVQYANTVPAMRAQMQAVVMELNAVQKQSSEVQALRRWRTWFGVRQLLFRNHPATFDINKFKRDEKTLERQLRHLLREVENAKAKDTYVINDYFYKLLARKAERVGYKLLKTHMYPEFFKNLQGHKLSSLVVKQDKDDHRVVVFYGTLNVRLESIDYKYPFRFDYDFDQEKVLRSGLTYAGQFLNSGDRAYDFLRIGSVYASDLDRKLQPQTIPQLMRNLRLKFADDDMAMIQLQMNRDAAFRSQIQDVVFLAFQRERPPAKELVEAYFYYWLMISHSGGELEQGLPTLWFQFNLLLSESAQKKVAEILNSQLDELIGHEALILKSLQLKLDESDSAEILSHPIRLDRVEPIELPRPYPW